MFYLLGSLYSSLQFTLLSRRKMTYHLVQTYFASIFFVIVTWLCFLISPDMFEVRVGIAMSTLLTLTAMFASVRYFKSDLFLVKITLNFKKLYIEMRHPRSVT